MDETTRAIGQRMREHRERAGLRQEDVAKAATEYGLGWARSSVAQIEAGTRTLTAHELVRLPGVLRAAGVEGDVSLQGLLRGLRTRRVRRVDVLEPDETERKAAKALGIQPDQLAHDARARWRGGLAEERDRRVARQTDSTTSRRRLQALRGHVTRKLLAELREDG